MRAILLIISFLFCGHAWSTEAKIIETNSGRNQTKNEQIGSQNSPIFVRGEMTTKKDEADARNDAEERKSKEESDAEIAKYTAFLAVSTFLLFAFTAALWWVTLQLGKNARSDSERQSAEMQASIREAIRSASAMEAVADATRNNAILMQSIMHKQMRAYLAFDNSLCVPQDVSTGWRYEVRFFIKNYGHTNAQSINVTSKLAIMDFPLPDTVDWTLPVEEKLEAGDMSPGQSYFYRASLPDMIADDVIAAIKKPEKWAMCLYGTVRYRDVFGEWHQTNFCKICSWDVKDNFMMTNHTLHNGTN